jgi:trehalose/maltose transport system permease protein
MRRAALVVVVAAAAFPLYWALVSSLVPEARLYGPPALVPSTLEHYRALFAERDFWTPIRNSLLIAATATVACVVLGAGAAYAVARLRFRGRGAILGGLLAASMLPQIAIVPPLFELWRALGLIDRAAGLVVPYVAFAMPLTVWLLVGTFRQLPPDVEEAARVDGAGPLRIVAGVVLPLAAPGLAAAAVLTFIFCWNELLFAMSFTTLPERQTVPVAVALFRGEHQVPWGQILAATVISTLPVVLLVVVFQRRIVSGLTAGAVR